jgi:hypothetical protein
MHSSRRAEGTAFSSPHDFDHLLSVFELPMGAYQSVPLAEAHAIGHHDTLAEHPYARHGRIIDENEACSSTDLEQQKAASEETAEVALVPLPYG